MLKQFLQLKLSQKLSPQQIQLMKLIELPLQELEDRLSREIEENPALETGKENEKDLYETESDYEQEAKNEDSELNVEDYLSDDDICRIMKGVNSCIPEMVKSIHFNKEHPENHNIQIPNKKISQVKLFNGNTWDTSDKKVAIENIITNLVDRLESEYGEEFRNNTTQFIQELWEKKTRLISEEKSIDKSLRKQVEYSILDGQAKIK